MYGDIVWAQVVMLLLHELCNMCGCQPGMWVPAASSSRCWLQGCSLHVLAVGPLGGRCMAECEHGWSERSYVCQQGSGRVGLHPTARSQGAGSASH
jgi:hypothetical protein